MRLENGRVFMDWAGAGLVMKIRAGGIFTCWRVPRQDGVSRPENDPSRSRNPYAEEK